LAARERARQLSLREKNLNALPSPFSGALAYLVGIAGGIYLSLSLLVDFLNVNVPARVKFYGLAFDPLAAVAVTLALLQPFLLSFYQSVRRKIFRGVKL